MNGTALTSHSFSGLCTTRSQRPHLSSTLSPRVDLVRPGALCVSVPDIRSFSPWQVGLRGLKRPFTSLPSVVMAERVLSVQLLLDAFCVDEVHDGMVSSAAARTYPRGVVVDEEVVKRAGAPREEEERCGKTCLENAPVSHSREALAKTQFARLWRQHSTRLVLLEFVVGGSTTRGRSPCRRGQPIHS